MKAWKIVVKSSSRPHVQNVFFNTNYHDATRAQYQNKYTLLDGLAYNTRGYFASCVVFFRAPQGRGKMRAMKQIFHGGNSTFINSFDKTKFLLCIMFNNISSLQKTSVKSREQN